MKNAWFLLLFSVFPFLSCSSAAKVPPGTLVIGVETGPGVLDPRFATDAISANICGLLYSGLTRRDENMRLVPHLAEKIEHPDDTTYLVKLRKGVQFHDGRPLTAADVIYTYSYILDPANASPKRSSLEKVASIEATDPFSLVIRLKEPYAPFPGNLTIGIVPEGSGDLSSAPVGSGPFAFAGYARGSELRVDRYDGYFKGRAKLSGVIFRILPDETVRLLELKKGNVHMVSNPITPAVLPWLEEQRDIKVLEKMGTNVSYIGFNMRDRILANPLVRKAIAYALDRGPIIEHMLKGLAMEAESIIASSNPYYFNDIKPICHDIELAKKLLDEAGYPLPPDGSPRFELTYKTSKNPARKKIAEVFARQLEAVGIAVKIQSFEWGTFYSDIKSGNFQMYSLTWVGISDPDIYHYIFHSDSVPPDGANRGRYSNPELDGLLEKGRVEMDERIRKGIYDDVQRIIAEDAPYVHLWVSENVYAVNRKVKGFRIYPDESLDSLVDVWLEE